MLQLYIALSRCYIAHAILGRLDGTVQGSPSAEPTPPSAFTGERHWSSFTLEPKLRQTTLNTESIMVLIYQVD